MDGVAYSMAAIFRSTCSCSVLGSIAKYSYIQSQNRKINSINLKNDLATEYLNKITKERRRGWRTV